MADTYNMAIDAGATYVLVITVSSTDLTDYSARMQFRRQIDSTSTDFEATTANGKLVLTDASNGEITLTITDTETAAFNSQYVYDLEIESAGGVVTRIMEGRVTVSPEVTR